MAKRNSIESELNKAARIALLVLIENSGHSMDSNELAKLTGVSVRSIQRDRHDAYNVHWRLAELLKKFNNPPGEQTFTIRDVAALVGLSQYRVRELAKSLPCGEKLQNGNWRFRPVDIVTLRGRRRKTRKHSLD